MVAFEPILNAPLRPLKQLVLAGACMSLTFSFTAKHHTFVFACYPLASELLSLSVKSNGKEDGESRIEMKSIHFFPGKDVCFAKPLLTCHRAIAQSKQRYARGEEKREAEHIAMDKGSGGGRQALGDRGEGSIYG